MANAKILVSDKLSEAGLKVIRDANGVDLEYKTGLSEDELCAIIGEFQGLVIRSATTVTPKVLAAATQLKAIGRACIGVDNIDIPAASKRGIVVMNTPTGNAVTTAEHAISLLCSLARKIPQAVASTKSGKWEKSKFQGREISNKTLGIIGLGNIGRIVADRAQGLKMKVIGVDPVLSEERAASLGIELVDIDTLYSRADFITIHTPLVASTKGLINDDAFEKMKDDALLVNAARGGIVDEAALARAVESGKIAGAALDVYAKEPVASESPLLGVANILVTPHLGASTSEAQDRVAYEIAHQVIDFVKRGQIKNAINVPSLPAETAKHLEPYMEVAKKLGALVGQLEQVDVSELRVVCTGEPANLGVSQVARAALAGFLEMHLEEPVNPISAPFEAEERGIHLVEVKESHESGHTNTVRVTITGEKGIHTVTGALGHKGEARLIGIDGYEIDAVVGGRMLVMRNEDRPGVIGKVGSLLGTRGINVSRMQVGLDESTSEALALWNIDSEVSGEALDDLRGIDAVQSVRYIVL